VVRPVERWGESETYERYVGRWSPHVARPFLRWLGPPLGARWVDVGAGTGVLTATILEVAAPASVLAVEPEEGFRAYAEHRLPDPRVRVVDGVAERLPVEDGGADAVVSGVVLNFLADQGATLREMRRAAVGGAVVAVYVWDYTGGLTMTQPFWEAAVAVDPEAAELDGSRRFTNTRREALAEAFRAAGLGAVETRAIEVRQRYEGFDDYWLPFLGGEGPAPAYVATLDEATRARLREAPRARLPAQPDGSIALTASAWAVRGIAG